MWVCCVCVLDRPASGFKQQDGSQSDGISNAAECDGGDNDNDNEGGNERGTGGR